MTQNTKYTCQVSQDGGGWTAQILRRVTSQTNHVTKSQDGFITEAEASAWGDNEVKLLLENFKLSEKRKRRDKKERQAQGK